MSVQRRGAALLARAGNALTEAYGVAVRPGEEADLTGSVVLITGGSRGLGFILARQFGREGCKIAICARDEGELKDAVKALRRERIDVFSVPCDVTDETAVERMVEAVTKRFGQVDILVNNAGTIEVGPLESMKIEDFRQAMDAMFWGPVYATLAILPQMRKRQSGRIVNITSIGGKISAPHLLPYGCAKFATVGFSEGLHAELARDGISVTTIAPGLMRTGSYLNALFKGEQKAEYGWFSLAATLPFISMDAERAAEQIVQATKRGEAERILSLPADLAARFHGLFPGVTAEILGVVERFLPRPTTSGKRSVLGKSLDLQINSGIFDALTALGRNAARRFNE